MERRFNSLLKGETKKYIKQTRILPHPSQMNEYSHEFSMEETDNKLLEINRKVLKILLEYGMIPRKIKIAFDFKKKLYYGEKDNPHVIGILAEKGTKKTFKWHTCAVILKGFELQIGSIMIQKGEKKEPFIRRMIEYLESLGFAVELSVMDRKYYGNANDQKVPKLNEKKNTRPEKEAWSKRLGVSSMVAAALNATLLLYAPNVDSKLSRGKYKFFPPSCFAVNRTKNYRIRRATH